MTEVIVKGQHGADSPYAYVEFDAGLRFNEERGKWVDETYMVPGLGGFELEEIATMLAERVERSHPGQGREAFESAKIQLLERNFKAEWAALQRKIRVHRRWGGPVPAAVLVPDLIDPTEWKAIVPDKNGTPVMYKVHEKTVQNAIPRPDQNPDVYRDNWSWKMKPEVREKNGKLRRP
jgi:hypothetical protein